MAGASLFAFATQFASNWTADYLQKAAGEAQSTIDKANTTSQNLINTTNANAANEVRGATNAFSAAQASLSNLTRSVSNQAKLDAGAKQQDAMTMNILRLQDSATQGSLDTQLRSAEQLGAVRASAAAAGVGGTTARVLQNAMALTAARATTAQNERTSYQTYDMLAQKAGLMKNTIASLDEGQTFAAIDYTVNVPTLVQSPIRASQFSMSAASQALLQSIGSMGNALSSLTGGSDTPTSSDSYSSGSVLNGINNFSTSTATYDTGNDSYGFKSLGGGTNGFYSSGSSGGIANFQLS